MTDIQDNLFKQAQEDLVRIDLIEEFPELDRGHSRNIYRITTDRFGSDNYGRVLKVAKDESKIKYNKYEFQTWSAVKSNADLRSFFCPIRSRSSDCSHIIMDYADPSNISTQRSTFEQQLLNHIDIEELPDSQRDLEIISSNLGEHRNQGTVMIDYPWGGRFSNI